LADARDWLKDNAEKDGVAPYAKRLGDAFDLLENITNELLSQAQNDPHATNALAMEYLDIFGYVIYAWLWARMMEAAARNPSLPMQQRILLTGRFYFMRLLRKADARAVKVRDGSNSIIKMPEHAF